MSLDRIYGFESDVVCLLLVDNEIRRKLFDPIHPPEELCPATGIWRQGLLSDH